MSFEMREELENLFPEGSVERELLNKINFASLPKHIAIIMDGNGRWAKRRNLPRVKGHEKGAEALSRTAELCVRLGIKFLTVYAFSKENWQRPQEEVGFLMQLLEEYLKKEREVLIKNRIKLKVAGDIEELPENVRKELARTMELTSQNDRMVFILALNYGGRAEILRAVKALLKEGISPDQVNEELFRKYLYVPEAPDPDLRIRTSGEIRISNFLLWEIAYTELYFTKVLWPDFSEKDLLEAIIDYQKRERRFGRVL